MKRRKQHMKRSWYRKTKSANESRHRFKRKSKLMKSPFRISDRSISSLVLFWSLFTIIGRGLLREWINQAVFINSFVLSILKRNECHPVLTFSEIELKQYSYLTALYVLLGLKYPATYREKLLEILAVENKKLLSLPFYKVTKVGMRVHLQPLNLFPY